MKKMIPNKALALCLAAILCILTASCAKGHYSGGGDSALCEVDGVEIYVYEQVMRFGNLSVCEVFNGYDAPLPVKVAVDASFGA